MGCKEVLNDNKKYSNNNGLSLFSTTKFTNSHEFRSVSGESSTKLLDKLSEIVVTLNLKYSDIFLTRITMSNLNEIWSSFPETFINGNTKEQLIVWILDQQEIIIKSFTE